MRQIVIYTCSENLEIKKLNTFKKSMINVCEDYYILIQNNVAQIFSNIFKYICERKWISCFFEENEFIRNRFDAVHIDITKVKGMFIRLYSWHRESVMFIV